MCWPRGTPRNPSLQGSQFGHWGRLSCFVHGHGDGDVAREPAGSLYLLQSHPHDLIYSCGLLKEPLLALSTQIHRGGGSSFGDMNLWGHKQTRTNGSLTPAWPDSLGVAGV